MAGLALILHVFVVDYNSTSRSDLIGVFSLVMLKWDAITQSKSFNTVQVVFSATAKQLMEQTMDKCDLLVGLEEENVVT